MLRAQGHSAQTVEDHHRTTDPRLAKLFQRIQGRGIGLALVDPCQHFVVAGLGADIGHSQPGVGQFAQLVDRLPAQVARQAVAGYPLHLRQVLANRLQHREQPAGRQYQGVAIGEKHPLDDQALAAAADLLQYLVLVAGAKFLLRLGIHLAKAAFVPGTAIGHREDQRMRLARGPEHRFDVVDGEFTDTHRRTPERTWSHRRIRRKWAADVPPADRWATSISLPAKSARGAVTASRHHRYQALGASPSRLRLLPMRTPISIRKWKKPSWSSSTSRQNGEWYSATAPCTNAQAAQ